MTMVTANRASPSSLISPRTFSLLLLLIAILLAIQNYVISSKLELVPSSATGVTLDRGRPILRGFGRKGTGGGGNGESNTNASKEQQQIASDLTRNSKIVHSVTLPHGRFTFWRNSHQLNLPKDDTSYSRMTGEQRSLLSDSDEDESDIDWEEERKRCASYGFELLDEANANQSKKLKRRRLFLGSLIADDSLGVLQAVAMEAYNVFHTVSFVESNATQNLSPRRWRYYYKEGEGGGHPSENVYELMQLFGPQTKVSVDYYVTSRDNPTDVTGGLILHEKLQKEGILHRWRLNGMRPDDVAIIADADEVFSRDFLRALQICHVPQFEPGQTCQAPKILGSTLVLESSPECITTGRRWHHPDAIIGECVDLIGSTNLHPPPMRKWIPDNNEHNITKRIEQSHGARLRGYGGVKDYSLYENVYSPNKYPLWSAGDFRDEAGGQMVKHRKTGWTGYHFHNFFNSADEIHWKYSTYGHAEEDAMDKPIWELHEDLEMGMRCAKGSSKRSNVSRWFFENFENALDGMRPIYYLNREVRRKRHLAWQRIVEEEEEAYTSKH